MKIAVYLNGLHHCKPHFSMMFFLVLGHSPPWTFSPGHLPLHQTITPYIDYTIVFLRHYPPGHYPHVGGGWGVGGKHSKPPCHKTHFSMEGNVWGNCWGEMSRGRFQGEMSRNRCPGGDVFNPFYFAVAYIHFIITS